LDGIKTAVEILTSIKRSGADLVITYHALEVARFLKSLAS
jgi:delta-aminolevulinic acid dehydratase/porphobilinogen synthase